MDIQLAYGREGLGVRLPAGRTTVVEPTYTRAADTAATLRAALLRPIGSIRLRNMVRRGQHVAVSICDVTRSQPRREMLEAILDEMSGLILPENVTILVATGTHRACSADELEEMLGREILESCRVVNHVCDDADDLVWMGRFGADVPVWLNRHWVAADIRITTGLVEPHFFAGFSGGPKMVAPGLAGLDTVLTLHDAARIGHPDATWGMCEGNPVHDDVRAIAAGTGVDFAFDVVLNRDHAVTHAFAGELFAMHAQARHVSREHAMVRLDSLYDVVVTTNAGYPLDQNLYQSVKGMTAAMNIVRPGGLIICAAACADGVPRHSAYERLLTVRRSPRELLEMIATNGTTVPDQWQVQLQARVQQRARVMLKTDGLTDEEIRDAHLERCHDIAEAVESELRAAGPQSKVCVLPEGPRTVPYVN